MAKLTAARRERIETVFMLMLYGFQNQSIARALQVTSSTVSNDKHVISTDPDYVARTEEARSQEEEMPGFTRALIEYDAARMRKIALPREVLGRALNVERLQDEYEIIYKTLIHTTLLPFEGKDEFKRLTELLFGDIFWYVPPIDNFDEVLGYLPRYDPKDHEGLSAALRQYLSGLFRELSAASLFLEHLEQEIDGWLNTLDTREHEVLLRFAGYKREKQTLAEICVALGEKRRENIRQQKDRALHKIRRLVRRRVKPAVHWTIEGLIEYYCSPVKEELRHQKVRYRVLAQRLSEYGEEVDEESESELIKLLERDVDTLPFEVRILNALKSANIQTVADLVRREESELLRYRNIGQKIVQGISKWLGDNGLYFGMDIDYLLPLIQT